MSIFSPNPYEIYLPQTVDPSHVFFDPGEARKASGEGRMSAWVGEEEVVGRLRWERRGWRC